MFMTSLHAYLFTCLLADIECLLTYLLAYLIARHLPAMETLFPTMEHKYCVKHIYNNLKVNHKGMELKSVLWRCSGTTSAKEFKRGMDHLKSLD